MLGRFVGVVRPEPVLLRIIPHAAVLNSANRRLWRTLHELLEAASGPENPLARLRLGKGWRLIYELRPDIWWIISLRAGAGEAPDGDPQRRVEFYIALPRPYQDVFTTKLKGHEQWAKCTVQEVPLADLELPRQALDLYALQYGRADLFSLQTDHTRQTSPCREICQVSTEMAPGDTVALLVRLEAVSRRRWRALAEYAWETWQQGGMPRRPSFDLNRLMKDGWRLAAMAAAGVKAVIDDLLLAIDKSFFGGTGETARPAPLAIPDPEREALMVNGALSAATQNKRNLPVFRTALQLLVSSPTAVRRQMLAHSLAAALADLHGDNYLQLRKLSIHHAEGTRRLLPPAWDRDPCLLSVDEVGRLVQLPTAEVQREFPQVEANRRVEAAIPAPFLDPSGIFAGTATLRGQTFNVYIPTTDPDMLMTARAFIGSPRMGKDQAAINLVVESALHHGIGAVVPDVVDERHGHRGMADAIRDHLPPDKVIDLDLGDFDHPVAIGMGNIVTTRNERIATSRIAQELTAFLMGDDVTNHQTREYLREFAKAAGGNLLDLQLLLTHEQFRANRIEELRARGRDVTLLADFHGIPSGRQGQIAAPILVRLGEILGDEALRPIFCQRPNRAVDLASWLRQGKVVIYRVPSRDLGELAVKTLMHWIVLTVFLTKVAQGDGRPAWLILNEPHQFLSPGLVHFCKRLLAEGPKHRLAPVFLFHNFRQLPADFVEILLSASLNWHVFKNTNDHVYERLRPYLEPNFTPQTAMAGTARFQFIASWLAPNGEYQPAFLMSAPALMGERYPGRKGAGISTRLGSRRYGRPFTQVEREIQERARAHIPEPLTVVGSRPTPSKEKQTLAGA